MTATQAQAFKWTALELEQQVLAQHPRVAVFDCDGTIWSGDSGKGFLDWSLEQGLVSRSTSDWVDSRYRAYLAGDVTELQICGEIVQIYAGLRESELQAAASTFVEQFVRARVFPEVDALLNKLNKAGVELWAVSSTNNWVVAAGVRPYGIPAERVLAAQVAVRDGIITSELMDVPTDEGKAEALRRAGRSRPDAVFGNSIHDLAMLEIAANAYPINPSPALLDQLASRGWGYFRPQAAEGVEASVGGE